MTTARREFDLTATLAHHDAEISALGTRMSGVETGLRKVSEDVNKGFSALADRLGQFEGSRGPSFGSILGWIAMGGGIISMSAAAITVLVTSFVSPPITRLEGEVSRLKYYVERREEVDRQDAIELRRSRDKTVASDIRQLEQSVKQLETHAASVLRGPAR